MDDVVSMPGESCGRQSLHVHAGYRSTKAPAAIYSPPTPILAIVEPSTSNAPDLKGLFAISIEPRTLRYFEERSNGQVVYACRHSLVVINGMKHQIVVDPQLMLKLVCLFTREYQRHSHIGTILLPARYQQNSEDKNVVSQWIGVSQAVMSSALAHHEHAGTSEANIEAYIEDVRV